VLKVTKTNSGEKMAMQIRIIKGLIALLRLPYWLMSGGLSVLTAFAISPIEIIELKTILLMFFSMAFVTSAGFSINDYFDRESDAVVKPKRPIPSGNLSPNQVVIAAGFLFLLGLLLALLINWLSLLVLAVDSVVLVAYSGFVKKRSGFIANITVGLLGGTAFIYGETAVLQTISLASLSLYPICLGTIGGNILRDVLSLEGDLKSGYPTLPQKIGKEKSEKVAAFFFILTALLSPLPFFFGFSIYYLVLITIWGALLIYASVRLIFPPHMVQNVKKYERMVTMSMTLLLLALIAEAIL
jgi:geranylgeranylglycerol-phosphate geranylgeranyltransferase